MKFDTGKVVCTKSVKLLTQEPQFSIDVQAALDKYINCDWGISSIEDIALNELAVKYGGKIFATYETSQGKIWIQTDRNRKRTEVSFPQDTIGVDYGNV